MPGGRLPQALRAGSRPAGDRVAGADAELAGVSGCVGGRRGAHLHERLEQVVGGAVEDVAEGGEGPRWDPVRRGGDQLADLTGQRHGDHVLRNGLFEADPRVIAFGDDVGQAVIDDDLDVDVGIVRQEARQPRL